ncbi:hypothetical protein GCM10023328_09920 [Modestobacter marinus]|uniref:Uncharacterized protein n=1 Tax=Modestobacter marinus TaxID=477641 RepID=A0A846LT06_9ACTN|nr:hypothetical protein [Modestobacter marinus]NIH66589.1 hypothetical protein [Modestobacter marinus]GGL47500.1 hypothetical protein GCM10011589_00040 [Modestobacter marinus]
MTDPAASEAPTDADDAVPFGPQTVVQAATADGLAAVARLHEEALAAIAALAESWEQPADPVRVLRTAERPAVVLRPGAATAA